MKRFVSIVLVLVLVLAACPVAFATEGHEHEFGAWGTFRSATETRVGLDRRYCKCGAYEEREVEKLPFCYYSDARDNEQLRSRAIVGAIVDEDMILSDWTTTLMCELLDTLTERHFNRVICVKYAGLGIGSFEKEAEHTVIMTAEQYERLMEKRDGLCLQMTTARASVQLDAETTAALKPAESIALHTKLDGDKLLVELLVDDKAVSVPMRVLAWCNESGKYIGTADSKLRYGIDEGKTYVLALSEAEGSVELEKLEYDETINGSALYRYRSNWMLRLGEKFA